MGLPSSYLFVPGNRRDRFEKAVASGADSIILDLEDAVPPEDKDLAREAVVQWFRQGGSGVVRINAESTDWFESDMAALAGCHGAEIMVPKATPRTIAAIKLTDYPLIPLIETVEGLVEINSTASASSVKRLAFGNLDFSSDARMECVPATLDFARFQISIASRYANLPPPIDGVTPSIDDDEALAIDIFRARQFGFTAKLCIHPRQVGAVKAGFQPTEAEITWAKGVVSAFKYAKGGVVQFEGKMIDKPVADRADYILGLVAGGIHERKLE